MVFKLQLLINYLERFLLFFVVVVVVVVNMVPILRVSELIGQS